jgi:histo-blood group ABO system transferase
MNRGLTFIIIGTQKYSLYAANLIKSIFVTQQNRFEIFLFTDVCEIAHKQIYEDINIEVIYHEKWPAMTMKRFEFILSVRDRISTSHLIYVDADALVVEDLGSVLDTTSMTFVEHPGFWREDVLGDAMGTWEERRDLSCFVPRESQKTYVCGGVWFGPTQSVLKMAEVVKLVMDNDLQKGLVAVWHDESYVNWYLTFLRSETKDPSYAYVDSYAHLSNLRPKIKVLDKPENWVRE